MKTKNLFKHFAAAAILAAVVGGGGVLFAASSYGFNITVTPAQVETPAITPNGATFSGTLNVTLATNTAGATIRYTTDNTDPTTGSTEYTAVLSLTTTTTIKAAAFNGSMVNSAVASAVFTAKAVAPVITPVAGTYTGAVTVTMSTSTGGATIMYTVNGGSSSVYSVPLTVTTTSTIAAYAAIGGMTDSDTTTSAFTVKALPPVITPAAGTYTGAATITMATSTGGATIMYSVNGGSASVYSAPITASTTSTVSAYVTLGGLLDSDTASSAFTIKAVTPVITTAAGTYTGTVDVTITQSDGGSIMYTVNGGSANAYSAPVTVTTTSTIVAYATKSGQISSDNSAASIFTIKAVTPVITTAAGLFTGSVAVTITQGDGGSIMYTENGGSATSYSGPVTVTTTTTIVAYATKSGQANSNNTAASVFTIKAVAPSITPVAGTYTGSVTITMSTSTVGATIMYTVNGGSAAAYSGPITASTLSTVSAYATLGGVVDSDTTTSEFTIKAVTPVITTASNTYTGSVAVTITQSDGGNIFYTVNGGSATAYSAPLTVTTTTTIVAYATKSGQLNSDNSAASTFTLKAVTPVITTAAGTYTGTVDVTITQSDSGNIFYTVNGGSATAYSAPLTVTTTSTIVAYATKSGQDNSDNSAASIFTIKAVTPVITPVAGTFVGSVAITITQSDGGSIMYSVNGGAAGAYSAPFTVTTTSTIVAYATKSGQANSDNTTASVFTIKAVTPVITTAAGTYTGTVDVTITQSDSGNIFYTINGGSATAYSAPITVTTTSTIVAYATKSGQVSSDNSAASIFTIKAVTPVITTAAGLFTGSVAVTITQSDGGNIMYTENGGSANAYSGPVTVTTTTTIVAYATKSGQTNSDNTAASVFTIKAATPVITPVAGTYSGSVTITISTSTGGATIMYSTNGGSAGAYSGPFTASTTSTIAAYATLGGLVDSDTATSAFTVENLQAETPTVAPNGGTFTGSVSVTLSTGTAGATIRYTTDNSAPLITSAEYTGALTFSTTTTIKAVAFKGGYSESSVASATFNELTAIPVITPAAGTFVGTVTVTMSTATTGGTIMYTVNGGSDNAYGSPFAVTTTSTIVARTVKTGLADSATATSAFTIKAVTPVITTAAGLFTGSVAVTITQGDGGSIMYTENGGSANAYSGPVTVTTTTTIVAYATKSGQSNSDNTTASVFTIKAVTPSITPVAGTYTGSVTITMSTSTAGATIMYTVNGGSAAAYGGPITASTTSTISAYAALGGLVDSDTATSAFTIQAVSPVITPVSGSFIGSTAVTITTGTSGATVMYSTNGGTATVYGGPFTVTTTSTIAAYVTKGGLLDSSTATGYFTITAEVLSVSVRDNTDSSDFTTWALGTVSPSAVHIMDATNYVLVKNNGNVAEDFSLSAVGTNWTLGSAAGTDTCVIMGLFNGGTAPSAGSFNAAYDLVNGTAAWSSVSGGTGNFEGADNGVNVGAGTGKNLYMYFKAPKFANSPAQETITITVGCRKH